MERISEWKQEDRKEVNEIGRMVRVEHFKEAVGRRSDDHWGLQVNRLEELK